jgi:hypothetical protein
MPRLVLDDHLLRGVLAGRRPQEFEGLECDGFATTNLWRFRLYLSLADPDVRAKLSEPVARLPPSLQASFRSRITALPQDIEVLPFDELAWPMAELTVRHRTYGRRLSATMAEALAAAWRFRGGIAVSGSAVDPTLEAAARADGIKFHIL